MIGVTLMDNSFPVVIALRCRGRRERAARIALERTDVAPGFDVAVANNLEGVAANV
ncbi:hypothetical protein [Nocardia carnea]|uniref:Uncharacterized protein n=1 Tax=Nocardia carnea TaxID=37328 RepID=A0ABW7TWR5_9NOCA|nr:hypothetical protein [Nocardia carnea]